MMLLCITAIATMQSQQTLPSPPQRLRVEHAPFPRGITMQQPTLSWVPVHTDRDQHVTAIEIIVNQTLAGDGIRNAIKESTAWRFKKIVSNSSGPAVLSNRARYNEDGRGIALEGDSDYTWMVRWQDRHGHFSPWSAQGAFSTALFTQADWQGAEWIGMDGPSDVSPYIDDDDYYRFRVTSELKANKTVARCSLMIAGSVARTLRIL